MSFFILGLPRSRTAWLANFLTYSGEFCYHEGIDGCSTLEEYKYKIKGKGDSTTASYVVDLNKEFPGSPKIIIEPEIDKTKRFLERLEVENIDRAINYLLDKLYKVEGPIIPFEAIDSNLEFIWKYLIPNKPFDEERAKQLMKFNIQVKDVRDYNYNTLHSFLKNIGEL